MTNREELLERITNAAQIELTPVNQDGMNLPDIDQRLKMLEEETARLIKESAGDIAGDQEQFRTVLNKNTIRVTLLGGEEIEQTMEFSVKAAK